MPYVSFFIYVRKKYKSRLQMFPIKKRLTCKETHENDPDEGDDASSDQSKANHPVGVFQVAAFHFG